MTSTLKFNNWQDAAGNAIYDASNGGVPVSGNAIINGDFGIWQRGTSFSLSEYTADRWVAVSSGATGTVTRQSFTAGDIEAIGYGDAEYYLRYAVTGADDNSRLDQRIEDVRTFAGQQVTISAWLRSSDATSIGLRLIQDFGSGGSSDVFVSPASLSVTSSWVRYSVTVDIPSVSGKTIGSGNFLDLLIINPNNETYTLDIWGVQLEAGPVATPFKLAGGGSKAAELALCQRYYQRFSTLLGGEANRFGFGSAPATSSGNVLIPLKVSMRIAPSSVEYSGTFNLSDGTSAVGPVTSLALLSPTTSRDSASLSAGVASGLTQFRPYWLEGNNNAAQEEYIAFSAEL